MINNSIINEHLVHKNTQALVRVHTKISQYTQPQIRVCTASQHDGIFVNNTRIKLYKSSQLPPTVKIASWYS